MEYDKFKTKEQYLQFRFEWKRRYKKLSDTIRNYKWMRREGDRMWNTANIECRPYENKYYYWVELGKKNDKYSKISAEYREGGWPVKYYSELATAMLEELKLAKVRAQEQYMAQKNIAVPV